MRTHYDYLQVNEKASLEVIRAAYQALAEKRHPDKYPDQREKAERYQELISHSYAVLSDAKLRAEYDAFLGKQRDMDSASALDEELTQSSNKQESTAPQEEEKQASELQAKPLFQDFWRGNLTLARSFWLYGVLGNNVVWGIAGVSHYVNGFSGFLATAVALAYSIMSVIGIWRSARDKSSGTLGLWGVLARVWCVLAILSLPVMVAQIWVTPESMELLRIKNMR